MTTLILVRHAKSAWDDASLDDHDRPLNDRGERDAPIMAARLALSGAPVDAIISSTALRARTTAAVFGDRCDVRVELDERLYLASAGSVFDRAVERGAAGADAVMVVAHDPGLSVLASSLAGSIPHMPTCAVATFRWDGASWASARTTRPDAFTYDIPRG